MESTVRCISDRLRRAAGLALAVVVAPILFGFDGPRAPQELRPQTPNRVDVLIGFTARPGPAQAALVRGVGGVVTRSFRLVPAIAASLPEPAVTALMATPGVTAIEPDGTLTLLDAELDASWGVQRIGAGTVHAAGNQGTSVKVAIIDSGVDYTHPELARNFAGGYDFVHDDTEPIDDNGHGTHVAGTIVALDDDTGVVGVVPNVSFYALKAFDATGSGSFSSVIAALEWAVEHGAEVANHSYGSSQDPGSIVEAAFVNAEALGVVHVAAAGNSGSCSGGGNTVGYPARYDSVIAVAATDYADQRPCFSSSGSAVELAAPGVSIYSTLPDGGYGWLSGTSMASPHVAGAAALIVRAGIADSNGNGRINDEVRASLIATSRDLGAGGRDNLYGFGLVDAAAAVAAVGPPVPGVIVDSTTDRLTYASGTDITATVGAAVTDEAGNPIGGLAPDAFGLSLDGGIPVLTAPFVETATAGTYAAGLDIAALADGTHTVEVTATDSRGFSGVGATAIVVSPAPVPIATLTSQGPASEAGPVSASVRVDLDRPATGTLTVAYSVSGTATPGSDYEDLPGSVTIPEGLAGATIIITPIDDSDVELDEQVRLTLIAGSGYGIGQPNAATITIASDDDPADLIIPAVSAPAAAAAGASFVVTDTTMNQGAGPAAASTTTLYLSADVLVDPSDVVLGSRAVPPLQPESTDTGTTTVVIPPATDGGRYWLIARANAGGLAAESNTANNNGWATLAVGPDLLIGAFNAAPGGAPGETVTVTDTTRNGGAGQAGDSVTRFYLSTNVVLDGGDTLVGGRGVGVLGPQGVSSGSTSVLIPQGTPTGTYYLLAKADGTDVVSEAVESNNTGFALFKIGADLVVSTLSVPPVVAAGSTMTVSDGTANFGSSAAAASTTEFYLSSDTALDAADTRLGSRSVPALSAGATSTGSTDVTIPAQTASGQHYVLAIADGPSQIAEIAETNNKTFRAFQIGADLVISSLEAPTVAGAGETVAVTDTTLNQGTGAAAGSMTRFLLSADFMLDPADVVLGERTVPSLGPGASQTQTSQLTIPAGTPAGTYQIVAVADANLENVETSEANNTRFRTVQVGADLVISALSGPATAAAGASIVVSDTTTNQGSGAAGASTTRFYLSGNFGLDGDDIVLGGRAVASLSPGARSSATTTLTIPASTSSGNYYLLAQADGGRTVSETSEANNTRFWSIKIGADLVVSAFSGPWLAGAGTRITLSDTTKNQGTTPAGTSTTRYFLSTNVGLDAADTVLGQRTVGALGPGATDAGSVSVIIPAGVAAGSYFLIALGDADNTVVEVLEGNNSAFRSILIGPDLTVPFASAPTSAVAGTPITVTDTTANAGAEPAGPSTTAVYLSADVFLDAGDLLLGSRDVLAVAAGASNQGQTPVSVPAGTAPGRYYLIIKADVHNAVRETQEANNHRLLLLQISLGG